MPRASVLMCECQLEASKHSTNPTCESLYSAWVWKIAGRPSKQRLRTFSKAVKELFSKESAPALALGNLRNPSGPDRKNKGKVVVEELKIEAEPPKEAPPAEEAERPASPSRKKEEKELAAGGPERFTLADAKGRLPVHVGAISKRLDTMSLLLELKGDVNALDSEGNTPLILAARHDDRWMAEVLLTYGADPDIVNSKGEDCFTHANQVMRDYINKWVQQKRFRGDVEFPLPPSPLHALYRVRVDCIPMLMYQDELEELVLNFFAKLDFEKPLRVIVPANPIHGWPLGFCLADYAEKQHALDICRAAKMEGIFMQRRRLNLINQGVHYQYKETDDAAGTNTV